MIRSRHELSFSFFCLRGSIASPTQCTLKRTVCLGFVRTNCRCPPKSYRCIQKRCGAVGAIGVGLQVKTCSPRLRHMERRGDHMSRTRFRLVCIESTMVALSRLLNIAQTLANDHSTRQLIFGQFDVTSRSECLAGFKQVFSSGRGCSE